MDPHTVRLQRCDRCNAAAKFQVLTTMGLDLLFCKHHADKHADVLTENYPVMPMSAVR